MEITKREIMVSICIGALILSIGFLLFGFIQDKILDTITDYDSALKIDMNKDLFNHAITTKVGNTLVRGNFNVSKGVEFPEIKGDYTSITKTKEEYTMHTRIVTYACGDKTCTRTEIYWSWDYAGEENRHVSLVNFLGNDYSYDLFSGYPESSLELTKQNTNTNKKVSWDYIYEDSDTRYYYDIVPKSFDGVIFINTNDGYLQAYGKGKIFINYNMTIQELLQSKEFTFNLIKVFYWFIILAIIAIVIYQYVSGENSYLEDNNGAL